MLKTWEEMVMGRRPKVSELHKKAYLWAAWKKRLKPLILVELRNFLETHSELFELFII